MTYRNLIGGRWVEGPQLVQNLNPADTRDLVGTFVQGAPDDMQAAVRAAGEAFPAWASLPAPARGAVLFKAADLLDGRFEQLSAEMTREEGKTLPESRGEVRRSINILRYFGGEGARLPGLLAPSERDRGFA